MTSVLTPGTAAARSASPAGDMMFAGASTSSRAVLTQRATQRRAVGHGREVVAGTADHEALDAGRRSTAAPAPAVVAADDGALGQRAHLLLDGHGQGRVERPRDRPAVAARAYGSRGRRAQPVGVGLERDDRERRAVRRVRDRDRVGVRQRAVRGAQLRRPRSRRGDQVGADGERVARGYLDVHSVTTTVDHPPLEFQPLAL